MVSCERRLEVVRGSGHPDDVKHRDTRIAFDHYDALAVPDSAGELRAVPTDEDVLVHVVVRPPAGPPFFAGRWWKRLSQKHPYFAERFDEVRAACGRKVKVIMPAQFNDLDPDSCERCVREVRAWSHAPAVWWQKQRERAHERLRRGMEQDEVAVWQATERDRQERQRIVERPRIDLQDWAQDA